MLTIYRVIQKAAHYLNQLGKETSSQKALISLVVFFPSLAFGVSNDTINKIDTYLKNNVNRGVSASILISEGENILLYQGYGLANRKSNVTNSPTTVFDIGSLTKQFTSAAILKLVEDNQLKLSDHLSMFFKAVPNDKKLITIHQLLTHTAGFKEYPGSDFDAISKKEYFNAVFSSELDFKPGDRYQYSNVGYSILSAIIEQRSNKDYETYLFSTFFKPLNMMHTGYVIPKWKQGDFARGYYQDFYDRGTTLERFQKSGVSPILTGNGGLQSTTGDSFKWLLAIKNNVILSKSSVQLLTSRQVKIQSKPQTFQNSTFYGYGWEIGSSSYSKKIISHRGNNGTFRSTMIWRPDSEISIIYLSNTESEGTLWLAYEIDMMLSEHSYTPEPVKQNPFRVIDEYISTAQSISVEKLSAHYKKVTGDQAPNSKVLNHLSRIYFHDNYNQGWALELLKLNVKLFPNDGQLWYRLAQGYMRLEQNSLALDSFKKSVKLAQDKECSWCDNANDNIKKLQSQ
jgi:CubicO group peptidase (beta-lactamase class C family)